MPPLSKLQIQQKFAMAQSRMKSGDLAAARDLLTQVHKATPAAAEPLFHLGRIARTLGELGQAKDHFAAARRLKPNEPAILTALGEVQALIGDTKGAAKTHDALIALRPGHPKPLADKALFLQQQGDFDAAEALFKKALRRAPDSGELYRMWLGGRKIVKGDPLLRKMQDLYAHPAMSDTGRIHLGFALAKAMEDIGAYDRVFPYLQKANKLQRQAFPYNPAVREGEVAGLIAASEDIGTPIDTDFAPIIVTGLPRSGTTLVEQILAAHDNVRAGGESSAPLRLAFGLFGAPPKTTPLHEIPDDTLRSFAQGYDQHVLSRFGRAPGTRVTDKSIQTHLILGHIHRAMPKANLIVVRRDPRDIALSIYKNYFEGGNHRYSNDLADLAKYIKSFDRIVAFWKQRLNLHEIAYEDLIADPEPQARGLIGAAGLDWQPKCLDFHKQGGAVKTLSIAQVRQPIYKSSGGAWRRYEAEMQPFIHAWEAE